MVREPLHPDAARRLIREIASSGGVRYSGHAERRMAERGLETTDCHHVLRIGSVEWPQRARGTWRYRVRAGGVTVVVAFTDHRSVAVVTAWREEVPR